MLSQTEIDRLISLPKQIERTTPAHGLKTDGRNERKDLDLESTDGNHRFRVFIRKNLMLIEDFSVGLVYRSNRKELGDLMLIRFNGSHGRSDWSEDRHYSAFHIHVMTEKLLTKGVREPKDVSLTDRFSSLEQALVEFFNHVAIENWPAYFPELKQIPMFGTAEGRD